MATLKVEPPLLPGYEYVSHLGTGGYSEVFLYRDVRLGRGVAVKVLTEGGSDDEARAIAAVSTHTHIVDVYHTGVTPDGLPFLVMQYYQGENFAKRLRRGVLDVGEVLKLGVELAGALEYAHRAGVMHRDVKPANILTTELGRAGLADFGIASHGAVASQQGVSLPWVAPEVLSDSAPADARSDVYSLAATLFTLLEGHPPFVMRSASNDDRELVKRTLTSPPPSLTRPDVPAALDAALRSALAKSPVERPQTAESFGRALQAVEAERGTAQTPLEIPQKLTMQSPVDAAGDDPDATRVRGVRVIDATAGDDSTRSRSSLTGSLIDGVPSRPAPLHGLGARRRTSVGAPADAESLAAPAGLRANGQTMAPPAPVNDERTSRGLRWWLGVVGVMVLASAVVIFVGSRTDRDADSESNSSKVFTDSVVPVVPDSVARVKDLTVVRTAPDALEVSWTHPAPSSLDGFRWERCDASRLAGSATASPLVVSPVPEGEPFCIEVSAVQDGNLSDSEIVRLP